jgi:hypothetical protein
MDSIDDIEFSNLYEIEDLNTKDIDNIIIDLDKTNSNLDYWLEVLSEMAFKIEKYCEENNLPIFNKHDKHDIVVNYFLNE